MKTRKINPIAVFLVFLFIVSWFPFQINANSTDVFAEEIHNDFKVSWFLISEMPYVYNISIQNLLTEKRMINLTMFFGSTSFSIEQLTVKGFYEWKNVSSEEKVLDYGIVTKNLTFAIQDMMNIEQVVVDVGNLNAPNFAQITTHNETNLKIGYWHYTEQNDTTTFFWNASETIGYHYETRYNLDWKPSKMQFFKRTSTEYKENMGEINIPKYGSKPKDATYNGTKWFRIEYETPMNAHNDGWGSDGRIGLNLSGVVFDPFWDATWGYRKNHTICNSTGAGTNYQVKIVVVNGSDSDSGDTVYIDNKTRSDFGDVRFINTTNTGAYDNLLLEVNTGINATFWVEITENLDSTNHTIGVYYGKPEATNTSDGDSTFLLFTDFNDYAIDDVPSTDDFWVVGTDANNWFKVKADPVDAGLKVFQLTESGDGTNTMVYPNFTMQLGVAFHFKHRLELDTDSYWQYLETGTSMTVVRRDDNGNSFMWLNDLVNYVTFNPSFTHNQDNWYSMIYKVMDTGANYFNVETDGTDRVGGFRENTPSVGIDGMVISTYRHQASQDYFGGTGTDSRYIFIRKFKTPEPIHGEWGEEETGEVNAKPINNSIIIDNMDDTNYMYSKEKNYDFVANWSDADGLAELDHGKTNFTDGLGGWVVIAIDLQNNAHVIEDGSEFISVGSITNASSGIFNIITIPIELDWDIGDASNIELYMWCNDTKGAEDPASGFEEKQTNYANIETDLTYIDLAINDYIVPNNTAITFNGTIIYQGSASNVTPPDADYKLNITLASVVKGSDSTVVNGYFQVTFNSENTEGYYYYHSECLYNISEGNYPLLTVYIGEVGVGGIQMGFIIAGLSLIIFVGTPIFILFWRKR